MATPLPATWVSWVKVEGMSTKKMLAKYVGRARLSELLGKKIKLLHVFHEWCYEQDQNTTVQFWRLRLTGESGVVKLILAPHSVCTLNQLQGQGPEKQVH